MRPPTRKEYQMNRRSVFSTIAAGFATVACSIANPSIAEDTMSEKSQETVMNFMGAMGAGDMEAMSALMADDMVWQNEGDARLPWIGRWEGKEAIFGFLGVFSENLETLKWENQDAFASGDTVAVFGRMKVRATKSGAETDEFTFALRAKTRDGQVVLWNWFEDSFAVSEAYHGN